MSDLPLEDAAQYEKWVECAKLALEYGFTANANELEFDTSNYEEISIRDRVAKEYGVSSQKMEELSFFL